MVGVGDPQAFMTTSRNTAARRPVDVRLRDWSEVYEEFPEQSLREQAARCMDCGIPFCHNGCPLGNLIPEWNDLTFTGDWRAAIERLHATNNFPEFTGRLCPAPCEAACVVGITGEAVSIKQVEVSIIDRAWQSDFVVPQIPERLSGKTVAVVGSGPAGLAAAQQLARAGHTVAVFERADRIGGLLRYGIPEFKLEKRHLDRRLEQMAAEGVVFRTGIEIGVDESATDLLARYDAVILAVGATAWRDLEVPGRDLAGIYQAMEYLPGATRAAHGDVDRAPIDVRDQHVVIIGGGDTGADCLGTALRQGAATVTQLEIMPAPPQTRPDSNPWPTYPMVMRVSSAHEEGGSREFAISTTKFIGTDHVTGLEVCDVHMDQGRPVTVAGTTRTIPADAVFLAMGFVGPERSSMVAQLGVGLDARGALARGSDYQTSVPGVFVAGDAGRGQSLIVWAIAEGRSAAAHVDAYLTGNTNLPIAIPPTARPLG